MTLYQEIRAAAQAMQPKMLQATKNLKFDALRMAKRMTLPTAGHTLLFDGEAAQNAFFDFWTHEYRVEEKTMLEWVDPAQAGLTPLETEVLEAQRQARTRFFKAEAVLPDTQQVRLHDLLEPLRPDILLTDFGMSESFQGLYAAPALFFRLVTVRGVNMTSGFSFAFQPQRIPGLLQAYRQKMKKVPPESLPEQRFIFFYQKYRQCGEDQLYQDVV